MQEFYSIVNIIQKFFFHPPGVIEVVNDSEKPLKRPSAFVINLSLIRLLFDIISGKADLHKLKRKIKGSH